MTLVWDHLPHHIACCAYCSLQCMCRRSSTWARSCHDYVGHTRMQAITAYVLLEFSTWARSCHNYICQKSRRPWMHTGMPLHTHVCAHVHTHVCAHVHTHVCAHVHTPICAHVGTHLVVHIFTHVYTHVCAPVHTQVGAHAELAYTHVSCLYAWVYAWLCTCPFLFLCACIRCLASKYYTYHAHSIQVLYISCSYIASKCYTYHAHT